MKHSLLFLLFLNGISSSFLFSQYMKTNIDSTVFIFKGTLHSDTIFCFGNDKPNNEIFKIVEEMPRFPGCEYLEGTTSEKTNCANQKLLDFIYDNLQYPKILNTSTISGRCYVTFVVEKDGRISNVELLRDIGGGCGAAAMEAVDEMFCQGIVWMPGKKRGQKVRVQFNLPIHFRL